MSDETSEEGLIDDMQKIYEDYAFIPPKGKGNISFAPACRQEVKRLFRIYGVTFKKAEIIDGR